jgi:hypothetical protein
MRGPLEIIVDTKPHRKDKLAFHVASMTSVLLTRPWSWLSPSHGRQIETIRKKITKTSHSYADQSLINSHRYNKQQSPQGQRQQPWPDVCPAILDSDVYANRRRRPTNKSAPRFPSDPSSSSFPKPHWPRRHR